MKNKILFALIFTLSLICIINLVSSESFLTFKQNEYVNYNFICVAENNSYCNSQTICVITINSPNGTNLVNDQNMTYNPSYFNYTLPTQNIGVHSWIILCYGNNIGISEGIYEITPTGFPDTLGFYLLLIIISAGILIFGFIVKDSWVVIIGSFGVMLVGIFIILFGLNGMKDNLYTWGAGLVTVAIAMYISVKTGLEMVDYL